MFRVFLLSAALLTASAPQPLPAQTGDEATTGKTPCKLSSAKKRGSSMLGGMLGGLASRAMGRTSIPSFIPVREFGTTLTEAIACKLDADEQKRAAAATTDAVQRGVGATSQWTSETRPEVSGSSTVTAQTRTADGGTCMAVNDVIIVNGEETTVSKQMCRAPGATGYTLAA